MAEIEANAAADSFDYFLCREPGDLRDYKPGEVTVLIQAGLMKNGVQGDRIERFPDQATALERALDLVVFSGKFYAEAWNNQEHPGTIPGCPAA